MKPRLVFPALLAAFVALLVAGCGGGGGSDSTDPATVVPVKSPVYVDFTVRPEGEAKTNIEALAKSIAGVDDLGGLIVSELEKSSIEGGEEFDFEKEVDPWLGKEAGIFIGEYDGDNFQEGGLAVQVSDEDEAREVIFKQMEAEDPPPDDASYEGVDFKLTGDGGQAIGVFDGLAVFATDRAAFKAMVDASNGDSLGGEDAFKSAVANVPSDSAADVYADIGGLIDETGGEIDSETQLFLDSVGIEPEEATAVASVIPGSNQIEIDFSTDLSGDNPPSGDASKLLGSLPATSVAALASAEFGERFNEGIDRIDKEGIPGSVPPHELKKALKEAGVDLEKISASVGDAGLFVTGNSKRSLGGALVLAAENAQQAKNTVSNLGLFLRASGTPGVTRINEEVSGFSIRSSGLGRQPVIVAAKGSRIAIGYGLAPTATALDESGETLASAPAYKEAVSALGGTPISGFADGPMALKLATALIPAGDEGFAEAKPYLKKISYLALGSEASGDLATAKLIIGIGK